MLRYSLGIKTLRLRTVIRERIGALGAALIWEFPEIMGTFVGVPIIRIIVYWGLYWGPLLLGNYHFLLGEHFETYKLRTLSMSLPKTDMLRRCPLQIPWIHIVITGFRVLWLCLPGRVAPWARCRLFMVDAYPKGQTPQKYNPCLRNPTWAPSISTYVKGPCLEKSSFPIPIHMRKQY